MRDTRIVAILLVGGGLIMNNHTPAQASEPIPAPEIASMKIKLQAQPFDLHNVRLLEGPFRHAQDLDRRYLLSLDPERLLHNFRINAGLTSAARPLGGWEAPDCELRGHFVGHYLSACARMAAATGDTTLEKNARYVVHELAKCQSALGNGYLSAFPVTFFDRVEARQSVWAPWYTLHKIFAGLQDMAVLCGDREALEVARKMADWAKKRTDRLSDVQMQRMLDTEHGGMNETLANLYALTGDSDYLALAQRFNHHAVLDPLAHHEDRLTGLHANTQIPKVIGAAREYELTGNEQDRTIAAYFWEVVTRERSYVIGGNSDGEHFSPKETLSHYLSPNTTETCNTYNMLKLTRHLFEWEPKETYADYYERALYNHILASQNPQTGMMCYYVPLRSGTHKTFNGPDDSFWCCTGTGVENHAQYNEGIYFHDGAKRLYVNLFIASELKWPEAGVTLRQETRFPEEAATHFTLTCAHPATFELALRHPAWAGPGYRIRVNGHEAGVESAPGSYAMIRREWKSGDVVELSLPMTLHKEGFHDNPRRLALLYGPIVLCAPVAEPTNAPAIVASSLVFLSGITPVAGQSLTFTGSAHLFQTAGQPVGQTVTLTPFYRIYDRNYVVYWDVFDPASWKEKEAAYHAEQERQRDLEARTVDEVHPDEEQSERDHHQAGERTYAGDFGHRKYRDARDSGWFSYDLKVLSDTPQELVVAYWGSDIGREFEILVDGVHLATQKLDSNDPDRFFEVVYPLPTDVTHGKERITIRFQAPPRGMAGGVFNCRVLRSVQKPGGQ